MKIHHRLLRAIPILVVIFLTACAASLSQYHTATVGAVGLHDALAVVQDTADVLHDAGQVTDVQYRALNVKLVPLLELGDQITITIRQWPVGTAAPDKLRALIGQVGPLTQALVDVLPEGVAQSALMRKILAVQVFITQLLLS